MGTALRGFVSGRTLPLLAVAFFATLDVAAQGSTAVIEQTGSQNRAEITQVAANARLLQSGSGNVAHIDQASGAHAQVSQTGMDNVLRGVDLQVATQAVDAWMTVFQQGEANVVSISQDMGAVADIAQTGIGNTAIVSQGIDAHATVHQNGNMNHAVVTQH